MTGLWLSARAAHIMLDWLMSDQIVYTTMYTLSVYESYLVIQGQVTEGWDILGPLHKDQQLLLHGFTHVSDGGNLFGPYVAIQYGSRRCDLHKEKSRDALLQVIKSSHM